MHNNPGGDRTQSGVPDAPAHRKNLALGAPDSTTSHGNRNVLGLASKPIHCVDDPISLHNPCDVGQLPDPQVRKRRPWQSGPVRDGLAAAAAYGWCRTSWLMPCPPRCAVRAYRPAPDGVAPWWTAASRWRPRRCCCEQRKRLSRMTARTARRHRRQATQTFPATPSRRSYRGADGTAGRRIAALPWRPGTAAAAGRRAARQDAVEALFDRLKALSHP